METDKQYREEAIHWLNSKARDTRAGLDILKKAGYKPYVTGNFEKNLSRSDIPVKVMQHIRLYIRYCTNPDNPVHEDDPPRHPSPGPETSLEGNIDRELKKEYPPSVRQLLTRWSDLYKARSIYHRELKGVGEQNDEKSTGERRRIGAVIEAASRRMDTLYQAFEAFRKDGTLPGASLFEEPFDPERLQKNPGKSKDSPEALLPETPEDLKKLKENLRTKIVKMENLLVYQSATRQEKENPMPEGPKRMALEKKLSGFKALREKAELKIAGLP